MGDGADEQQAAESAPDPQNAEQRRAEGGRRGRPRVREPEDEERAEQRGEHPAEEPGNAPELDAQEREGEAHVSREHERTELPGDPVELVQGDDPARDRETEQPPASEIDEADDERQQNRHNHEARHERGHRAPNLLRRCSYSSRAARSSSGPKSGHSASRKTSSEYADCQRRKFEMRCSPEVRMTRSGSGSSGA